ncbi:hypothetical protein AB0I77_06160 [Streptomyces sp. NPDC050619]|uniref:hypothetical protein n=1 Tax=Streptomyces sp. NPDC050619 TaxID=3157214 RepID=UPI00341E9C5F
MLYLERPGGDDELRLSVGPAAYAHESQVLLARSELMDALGRRSSTASLAATPRTRTR